MVWYPDCLLENKKDSGYSFVVGLGSMMSRAVLFSIVYSFGVYYVEILNEFNTSKSTAAWVGSILVASVNLASVTSSVLLNRFGARLTCTLSAVVASFGLISSVFSTSIYYLLVTYGIITGFGMGIAMIPIVVSVNEFFDKLKHYAQSIASSGSSLGMFIGPIIAERLISYYGWRGSILITSAIVLNLGALGLLFRPFHESKRLPLMCTQASTLDIKVMNWQIFKHKGFICVCFANASVSFASSIIMIHLSAFAQLDAGLSTQQAAILLAVIGIMGIPARLIYGELMSRNLPPYAVLFVSSLSIGLSAICLPFISHFTGFIAYSAVTGTFLSASGGAVWPALLTDLLGDKNLSNSMGSMNFVCTLGSLSGAPLAGWLADKYQTYKYSFIMAGSSALVASLVNSYVWRRFAGKRSKPQHTLLVVERVTSL